MNNARRNRPRVTTSEVAVRRLQQAELRAQLRGLLVLFFLLIGGTFFLDWLGSKLFESIDVVAIATRWHEINPFFRWVPRRAMEFFALLFNGKSLRYTITPISAFLFVILAAVRYVQDIYLIATFKESAHFVFSAVFSIFFPKLVIDNGKIVDRHPIVEVEEEPLEPDEEIKEFRLLEAIGGPGRLVIEPGNAIVLEHLRGPSDVLRSGKYFVTRFERIGSIASLEDQQMTRAEFETMSRDGIRIMVRDVRIRYRILMESPDGTQVVRTQEEPFPFSDTALVNLTYNQAVDSEGRVGLWAGAVMGAVVGRISAFINEHDIDYLTAPRNTPQDPRREILDILLNSPAFRGRLAGLGAELLWADIGHMDIVENDVDASRLGLWQAQLHGNANIQRAYGEAKRVAYRELGRAQGQAELIMSIANSLEDIGRARDPQQSLSELFLLRTAQIIDSLNDRNTEGQPGAQRKPDNPRGTQ